MYDREQNYTRKTLKREARVYKKLLATYNALLFAADEGVYEVTVRSQAGTVVVPVSLNDGGEITHLVIENFGVRLNRLEGNFNKTIEEAGLETIAERKKEESRTIAHEATCKQAHANYAAQGRVLAQQAAAGAAAVAREEAAAQGAKKAPGRPRKAAIPSPEVSQRVAARAAARAAAVPMNAADTLPTAKVGEGPAA